MSAAGDSLLIVTSASVIVRAADGGRQRTVPVAVGEPLRDAVATPDGLLVLTPTRLIALDG